MQTDVNELYYQRQLHLDYIGIKGQIALQNAKVLVVGSGGLGCPVLMYLARAGVGCLGIVDGDKVSITDLHRQILFEMSDIGLLKTRQAKKHLKKINPNLKVEIHDTMLFEENALNIISKYVMVVDATDNFGSRYLINDCCEKLGIPMIYGAVYKMEGYVSVFHHSLQKNRKAVTFRDLYPEPPKEETVPDCSQAGVLGITTGLVGMLQANEVIKIILGNPSSLMGKILCIDLISLKTNILEIIPSYTSNKVDPDDYNINCSTTLDNYNSITAKELNRWIQENKSFKLIDIRPSAEYVKPISDSAIKISFQELENNLEIFKSDQPVVLYCQFGQTSQKALKLLRDKYYLKNVYHLTRGASEWFNNSTDDEG